jgi:hypothetical protein
MSTVDTTPARERLGTLRGRELDEAASTYLLGVLEVDLPDDVEDAWRATFPGDRERAAAEQAVERLPDIDREQLLRLAMTRTLEDRPETATAFVSAIEQAGRSMFVAELAALTFAAALLLREWHRKGRASESRRRETRNSDGSVVIEIDEVRYVNDGPLANLLATLGLSQPGMTPP